MAPSHNDLFKPDNLLFDGKRVWLVDWEAAFLNDRYADLAVVANLIVANEIEENVYLQEYFGAPPDPYQRARFFLMQQLSHIFYAMVFLLQASPHNPLSRDEDASSLHDFRRRFWAGEIHLTDTDTRRFYGTLHWKRFVQDTRQPRFDESLRIVSDGHAGVEIMV